jgi:hypothetical protein
MVPHTLNIIKCVRQALINELFVTGIFIYFLFSLHRCDIYSQ